MGVHSNGSLFHIAASADWAERRETYAPAGFAADGFIHCSTRTQLMEVAKRLFRGRRDLVVLVIEPDRVRPPIRYENLEGGRELYPHIYGRLNLDAVTGCEPLRVDEDGSFTPVLPGMTP